MRLRTRLRTDCGTRVSRLTCQNGRNSSLSARSGGRIRNRSVASSPACSITRSASRSRLVAWSPTAWRSIDLTVRLCERLCTNPARWAASWTLSVKTRVFFSDWSRFVLPKSVDSATDSWVATAEPRKRIPSRCWQAGQLSLRADSSASLPTWVRTGITEPSRRASSSVGGLVRSSRRATSNQRSEVVPGSSSPPDKALSPSRDASSSGRKRPCLLAWSRRMLVSLVSSELASAGDSATPQPERPQCRQKMAGKVDPRACSSSSTPNGAEPSSDHQKVGSAVTASRSIRVSSRTHRWTSTDGRFRPSVNLTWLRAPAYVDRNSVPSWTLTPPEPRMLAASTRRSVASTQTSSSWWVSGWARRRSASLTPAVVSLVEVVHHGPRDRSAASGSGPSASGGGKDVR